MMSGVKNMQYDVLIIGAGPGGIFTTYELVTRSRKPLLNARK